MTLFIAFHKVPEVTAKVPFSIIQLHDQIKMKNTPAGFKCRHVFPTSGETSVSVWDSTETDGTILLNWLTENINADCNHEVHEIQEAFALGLGEIQRARATDKVASGTAQVADKTAKAMHDLDTKMRISERTGNAMEAVKESAVMQQTGAAFTKAGESMRNATRKVMEQPAVSSAADSVSAGFRKLTASFSSMTGRNTATSSPDPPAIVPENTSGDP